jgi:thiol:disulfide interchange protein DsbC
MFNFSNHRLLSLAVLCGSLLSASALFAQGEEALIRKNLKERMPHIQPIDEIKRTPMAGLFELRVDGTEIYYTDASGSYLIQGQLIDTKSQRNLTDERAQRNLK